MAAASLTPPPIPEGFDYEQNPKASVSPPPIPEGFSFETSPSEQSPPALKPTIQEPAPSTSMSESAASGTDWLGAAKGIGYEALKQSVRRINDPLGSAVRDVKSMFTPSESLKQDINAQASLPPATETPVPEGFDYATPPLPEEGSNFAWFHRGLNRQLRDLQPGRVAVGELSPQEAAQNYVYYEREARKYKYDPDVAEALQAYPEEGSSGEVFAWAWNNPKATVTVLGDNIAGMVVGAAIPLAAGTAATPFGPGAQTAAFATTAGLSSAVMTALNDFTAEMQDSGIDINSVEQVNNAFASPEFMAKATRRALLHGVPVGIVDSLTSLIGAKGAGGKLVDGVWKQFAKSAEGEAMKGTVKRAIAESGVNAAIDMAGAGVGEAAGELLSTGSIQPSQLIPEVAFELPGSIVQGGYETYLASKGRVDPASAEMIAKAGALGVNEPPPPPPPVDADTAAAEGRTFYGYAEPGKPVEVTTDYSEAERKMGAGAGSRGTLIAVRPEEVEGDAGDVASALIDARKKGGSESQVIDQLVATVPEEQKPAAVEALTRLISSKSPEERDAAWTAAQSFGVKITPQAIDLGNGKVTIGTYRGPLEGRVITPRLEQPLRFGGTKLEATADGNVIVQGSGLTDSLTDIDGKKFFQAMKGKAILAVGQIRAATEVWGRKAIEPMVQIADESLRQQVFESNAPVDVQLWRQAVRDGKVTFNPDGRMFSQGRKIGVIDATKEEVKKALEIAKIKQPKGTAWLTQQEDLESNSGERKFHEPFRQRFTGLQPGEVHTLNFSKGAGSVRVAITELAKKWQKDFNLEGKLVLFFHDNNRNIPNSHIDSVIEAKAEGFSDETMGRWIRASEGIYTSLGEGVHVIGISLNQRPASIYHTLVHEFGHYLSASKLSQAPVETRAKVFAAYRRWLEQLPEKGLKLSSIPPARRHFSANYAGVMGINDWFYQDPSYMFSFEEWFAEQVARWGTTKAKPLGTISRFFQSIARAVIAMVRDARSRFPGEKFEPETEISDFLTSLRSGIGSNSWGAQTESEYEAETREKNRPYLQADTVPLQAETTQASVVMRSALNRAPQINPSTVASINAHNDRFNWFYKVGLTLRQVALRNANNPLLAPLYRYLEYVDLAKQESNRIMGDADQILLKSRNLKGKGMDSKLAGFIDDLNNMVYLSPQEQQNGVRRHPTQAEFASLVRQYGLSNEAVALYMEIKGFFDQTVERFYQLDVLEAGKLSDPRAQAAALKEALTRKRQMLAAPYFPKSRFGKWAVTVRDSNGKVESFELFDTKRLQGQRQRELETSKLPGQTVTVSELPQEAEPFVGIPAWLLDKLNGLPGMTPLQKQWIEQLRYHLAPQRSFAKHFLKRKNTAGYSLDWRRSFANYAFHHARNFSRLKYGELARKETDLLLGAEEERTTPFLSRVGNMMADHYKEFINPSRDWAVLRSITALFHLGFSPATAMMNLSQVPLVTLPFLADKFGDGHAMGALTRAAGNLATYYKKGTVASQARQPSAHEFRALNAAMQQGIIDESQAWQLASFAGGSKSKLRQSIREKWLWTTSKGMFMFSMAEQWNRRVTFRAAYDLAYNNPTAKWIGNRPDEGLRLRHTDELNRLMGGLVDGHTWTEREALAFLAAKETVQQTQFAYDKMERPKFMQGRKANLFAFYMFTQNMLFTMWNNPGAAGRYMLAMAVLAGPMGLVPDDIEDILNAVARQLFGKDFNLERYARSLVVDMIGETPPGEEPKIAPDLILHGTSRYSYGIPWLMSQVGVDWLPNVDRSKSIAINRALPMGGVTSLLKPSADVNQSIYNATQDVAGAAFGPGLALYKALSQSDLSLFDLRNWQAAMPKAARSVTEGLRNLYNGGQIDRKGAMQVPYDRNDPQQVAELIATMLGYQPTRKSQFYDRQSAIYEVDQYWTTRRSQLLQDAFTDRFDTDDPEAWADAQAAIREFNTAASQVDKKYIITSDSIKRSFQAKQKRRKDMERGMPAGVSPGAAQSVGRLYPEANVIFQKKVR